MTDSKTPQHAMSKPEDNPKTLLANVRLFDGTKISPRSFVVIDGDKIGSDPRGARLVNCKGGILLPGLFDCHVHPRAQEHLDTFRQYGLTTVLDMECFPDDLRASLRHQPGTSDLFSANYAAYYKRPGEGWPTTSVVKDVDDANNFVAARAAEGADFIKLLADPPPPAVGERGIDQDSMNELVSAAESYKKLTIAHCLSPTGLDMALEAGVHILTHAPLAPAMDGGDKAKSAIARMVKAGTVCVPTLTMMKGTAEAEKADFEHAEAAVKAMYELGIPILAGTDCNNAEGAPTQPAFGDSLHQELELLVGAGMSNLDALRAATVLPPKYFQLDDRGSFEPGKRADLVLLSKNPLDDIKNTRSIQKVWFGGKEFDPAAAGSA